MLLEINKQNQISFFSVQANKIRIKIICSFGLCYQRIKYLQMFPLRNRANFIVNCEQLEAQKCAICFEINEDIYRCTGPCQKLLCIDCVDRFASINYKCTFCSNGKTFEWKPLEQRKLIYQCPYEPAHMQLISLQQFTEHCYECPQMRPEHKVVRDNLVNFNCQEGHRLIFLSQQVARRVFVGRSYFQALTNSECTICKQSGLCRAYCPDCSTGDKKLILYCVKCRFPPGTKTHCPLGHELERKNYRSMSSICDFCGYSDRFSNEYSYTDSTCNFDACFRCYLKLPNQNKLVPLKNEFKDVSNVSSVEKNYAPIRQINDDDLYD